VVEDFGAGVSGDGIGNPFEGLARIAAGAADGGDDQDGPIVAAVAIGVGASLDFLSGFVTRAPRWVSNSGFEWAYRLVQDPKRLWRRYLLRGPRFVGIVWRTAWMPKAQRLRSEKSRTAIEVHH
jgi:hypothetical protein